MQRRLVNASSVNSTEAELGADMTSLTFPRSLLPMLMVQGSQWLGAIVANTPAVALAALACALLFARSPADRPTDERYAVARFPSLPIAVAAATMDGTTFAVVSALIGLRDSSDVGDLVGGAHVCRGVRIDGRRCWLMYTY